MTGPSGPPVLRLTGPVGPVRSFIRAAPAPVVARPPGRYAP